MFAPMYQESACGKSVPSANSFTCAPHCASASAVGLLVATFYAFPLVLSWPVGVLADRLGSRGLLVCGAFCGAAGMAIALLAACCEKQVVERLTSAGPGGLAQSCGRLACQWARAGGLRDIALLAISSHCVTPPRLRTLTRRNLGLRDREAPAGLGACH